MKWETRSVGEFCKLVNGKAFKADDWSDSGLPIIRIQNLNDSTKPFNHWDGGLDRQVHIQKGDLLIAWSGTPGTSFGAHIWNGPEGVLNQHIFRVDLVNGEVTKDWLKFCVNIQLLRLIDQAHGGVGLKHVTKGAVQAVKIPLPPLAEQKRIAGILDGADALRAKRRESLAQLDILLQSTFLDIFGDPVTNPMEWKVSKFKGIGSSRLGKMLDKGKEIGNCQLPYLANFNVQWGRFVMGKLRQMDFDEDDREEFELRNGDLLICEGGEVGRTAIWRCERENVYFQKALHRVRLDPSKAVPEFAQYFMWFMAKNGGFRDFTNSATIAHLTGAKLKGLPVPLPPLDLQRRFAAIVASVEQQKARLRTHLTELDALFASLQSRAFNGEL